MIPILQFSYLKEINYEFVENESFLENTKPPSKLARWQNFSDIDSLVEENHV